MLTISFKSTKIVVFVRKFKFFLLLYFVDYIFFLCTVRLYLFVLILNFSFGNSRIILFEIGYVVFRFTSYVGCGPNTIYEL